MKIIIPAFAAASLMISTAALAQTTPAPTTPAPATPTAPATPPARATDMPAKPSMSAPTMTEEQAKNWIDKTVYSSDDKSVGEVAAIMRDAGGKVTELHADVGGFLGLGTTRVRVMPDQFAIQGEKIVLKVAGDQVKSLPKVEAAAAAPKK